MAGPRIQCHDLGLSLGGVDILTTINLEIGAGEIHCVIGPNGGGKTSLIRCLLGQMPHTGNIEFVWDQTDCGTAPQSSRACTIGYVPQFLDFDRSLPVTVNDFMAMVCNSYRPAFSGFGRGKRTTSEAALQRVGLAGKGKTRLGNLSGGERQRVLFAQALIPQPDLLVLDEPMTSLDHRGEEIFLGLIDEFHHQGVTIVWVAHDLQQVRQLATSISCINRDLVFAGPAAPFLDSEEAARLFRFNRPITTEPETKEKAHG